MVLQGLNRSALFFSAALPLFMLHRELALRRHGEATVSGDTGWAGTLSLLLVAAVALAYSWIALTTHASLLVPLMTICTLPVLLALALPPVVLAKV